VQIHIGCVPDLPLQRLQSFLGLLYLREHPLRARVTHLRSAEQLRRLRAGDLQLALIHDTGEEEEIETEPVFPGEPLAAFVPHGHRFTAGQEVGLEDLRREVLVLFPRRADPGLHDWLLATLEFDGGGIHEPGGADIRDLLFAVADGNGVTVGPRSTPGLVGELGGAIEARPLAPPQRMPDTVLAWAASGPQRHPHVLAAAREVARVLRRAARH
jgi:LysR substrate binding domain